MEILKSELKHQDPAQDISWEDNDLIIHLKEEMIRVLHAHPAKIQEVEGPDPKIVISKSII